MSDLKKLGELIAKAKGKRTKSLYGIDKGITATTMLKYIRGEAVPTPEEIRLLASDADNGVTYEKMMNAAGYKIKEGAIVNKVEKFSKYLKAQLTFVMDISKALLDEIENPTEAITESEKQLLKFFRGMDEISQELLLKQLSNINSKP